MATRARQEHPGPALARATPCLGVVILRPTPAWFAWIDFALGSAFAGQIASEDAARMTDASQHPSFA